jgi:hypothetical protein
MSAQKLVYGMLILNFPRTSEGCIGQHGAGIAFLDTSFMDWRWGQEGLRFV